MNYIKKKIQFELLVSNLGESLYQWYNLRKNIKDA